MKVRLMNIEDVKLWRSRFGTRTSNQVLNDFLQLYAGHKINHFADEWDFGSPSIRSYLLIFVVLKI